VNRKDHAHVIIHAIGIKEHSFQTSTDFNVWKEAVEEESYTYYTKEKEYKPSGSINMLGKSTLLYHYNS